MNKEKLAGAETANVGLDSSVGLAPTRQSGGRRFKSRSRKFVYVYLTLSKICTQSVSIVVYHIEFVLCYRVINLINKKIPYFFRRPNIV